MQVLRSKVSGIAKIWILYEDCCHNSDILIWMKINWLSCVYFNVEYDKY